MVLHQSFSPKAKNSFKYQLCPQGQFITVVRLTVTLFLNSSVLNVTASVSLVMFAREAFAATKLSLCSVSICRSDTFEFKWRRPQRFVTIRCDEKVVALPNNPEQRRYNLHNLHLHDLFGFLRMDGRGIDATQRKNSEIGVDVSGGVQFHMSERRHASIRLK